MIVLTSTERLHGWAIFGPRADKNTRKGELVELPASEKFSGLFLQHALRYQFEIWYIHLVGSATHQVRVSSQSDDPDLLYSPEWIKVIFLHLWPQKLYRAFRFGTLLPISCSYPRHSQLTRHSLMLANGHIRQSLTALFDKFQKSISFLYTYWVILNMQHPSLMKNQMAVTLATRNTIKLETLHHHKFSFYDICWQFTSNLSKLSSLYANTQLDRF